MKSSGQIKVELQSFMGSDKCIADSAWTSSLDYQKKQSRNDEDVKRVVEMLANAKHSVPFESVILRFWIKLPIQTDRQLMTHRIASHSGMSGRYRTMPSEFLEMPGDISASLYQALSYTDAAIIEDSYYEICEKANQLYRNVLSNLKKSELDGSITNQQYKRIREFYRGVLPQNNMTERVSILNLRSFANFIKLRLHKDAQPEIQEIAKLMLQEVKDKQVAPIAIQWLEANGWNL